MLLLLIELIGLYVWTICCLISGEYFFMQTNHFGRTRTIHSKLTDRLYTTLFSAWRI